MVKIKMPLQSSASPANNSFNQNNISLNDSQNNTPSNDNAKLWDNDELVMKALRVYGKMPRPQVFNEISRVCKLSNLRKSRYFHEKMMKNNPYKDKIMKIIEEEGEHNYPYFKIFFEEYKTKKQRLSLINNENNIDSANVNYSLKKEMSLTSMPKKLNHSVENSVENSNDYENSCSDQVYYNNDEVCTESYDYNYRDDYENDDITDYNNEYVQNNTEYDATENIEYVNQEQGNDYYAQDDNQLLPLVDTNFQYLENLELKLKILNKERDHMDDYFKTFTTVIDNLKNEIILQKNNGMEINDEANLALNKTKLDTTDIEYLGTQLKDFSDYVYKLKGDSARFCKDQAALREELKVTKNFATVENNKLRDELDSCKAQLDIKDEEITNLKKRLEDSMRSNRNSTAKHVSLQNTSNLSKVKFNELKENMDRMFAQIQALS